MNVRGGLIMHNHDFVISPLFITALCFGYCVQLFVYYYIIIAIFYTSSLTEICVYAIIFSITWYSSASSRSAGMPVI